jgi:type II secretory pathway component PulF
MAEKSFMDKANDFLADLQNIKIKDKLIFYRLLATMTNAGMTLVKSIKVLEAQEKNPVLKRIL